MQSWLVDHLICPACKTGPFELVVSTEGKGQVIEGALRCPSCGVTYPIRQGIPRFVDSDQYVEPFSFQRRAIRGHWGYYTTEDSAERLFPDLTPIPIEQYQKGVLLDAGCGYGRWVRFFSQRGVRVVGVDLSSESIELCASESSERENVGLIQGDINNLPFPVEHFDNVFCFGVLHHTPDPGAALGHIAKHLKPGGNVSVYVYPESPMVEAYRHVTTRIPPRLFYWLSLFHNYMIMSWMRHLGPLRRIYTRLIPGQGAKKAWQRVHADLDQFTPVYAHRTTYPAAVGWFRDLRLEDIQLTKRQISITARKPTAGTRAPSRS